MFSPAFNLGAKIETKRNAVIDQNNIWKVWVSAIHKNTGRLLSPIEQNV